MDKMPPGNGGPLNWRQMLEMNGTAGIITNGAVLPPAPKTKSPIAAEASAIAGLHKKMLNDYPLTPAEKQQSDALTKIMKDNNALITKIRAESGQRPLDPAKPEEKALIDQLTKEMKIPQAKYMQITVKPVQEQGSRVDTEIMAKVLGEDKPAARMVFSPQSDKIVSLRDGEFQKTAAAVAKSAFAVFDKDKALFDKIKAGDQSALGSIAVEIGKAAGLRDGEKFTVSYTPFTRNVDLPGGDRIKAHVDSLSIRLESGNLISLDRAVDKSGQPIETTYRTDPRYISIGALKANIDAAAK